MDIIKRLRQLFSRKKTPTTKAEPVIREPTRDHGAELKAKFERERAKRQERIDQLTTDIDESQRRIDV